MTIMKKSLLALSVAAMPVAGFADLQPMNNTQMGEVTGQQGVTIELETALTIDQIEYSQDTNGSVLMDNIRVGGHDAGETLDVSIEIDLQDSGDAVIDVRPLGLLQPVEQGLDVGSVGLSGDDGSATLISDLQMDVLFSQLQITAKVDNVVGSNNDTGSINIQSQFLIEDLDVDFDVAAVSLKNMRLAGAGTLNGEFDPNSNYTLKDASDANLTSMVLGGGAAQVTANIGAGAPISDSSGDDVLRVNISEFTADMWMPTVKVGQASIGSIGIDNLNITDTDMAIYGRQ